MKKILGALMIVATVTVAQADLPANIWNINWAVRAAYSPEGGNILDDYAVTWSLFNAADPSTALYSMTSVAGADSIGMTDERGKVLSYIEYLEADTSVLYGATDLTGKQSVYQRLDISGTSGDYYWVGQTFDVTPVLYEEGSIPGTPTDLDISAIVGKGNNLWTKVEEPTGVPEPATMSLLGLGALAMALRRKLRK